MNAKISFIFLFSFLVIAVQAIRYIRLRDIEKLELKSDVFAFTNKLSKQVSGKLFEFITNL